MRRRYGFSVAQQRLVERVADLVAANDGQPIYIKDLADRIEFKVQSFQIACAAGWLVRHPLDQSRCFVSPEGYAKINQEVPANYVREIDLALG